MSFSIVLCTHWNMLLYISFVNILNLHAYLFLSKLLHSFIFFRNFCFRPGCCNYAHSCILLTPLLLPACHNVNRFVASSLFLCRVIFPYSYRILLLCWRCGNKRHYFYYYCYYLYLFYYLFFTIKFSWLLIRVTFTLTGGRLTRRPERSLRGFPLLIYQLYARF